ncbi:MAG: Fe-S cluster assembly scaffold protein NifU [Anaerolineae bacterium]|nr:Fe-S cluster assembly scaffold protein NifU [Anaerolineae bacterium]
MQYSDKVMDHFMNPRNVGVIDDADGVGRTGNPVCGDLMEMSVKIQDDVIADVKFRTFGCGAAIATSSMATELIKGKTVDEALEITNRAIAEALDGLPPIKMHCSVLAADALRATLADYYTRRGELQKAAALMDRAVKDPRDTEEARDPLHWDDFARMVRALNSAYPDINPMDLNMAQLFRMVLNLPGFDDDPDAVTEEQLEKLQLAWYEMLSS